MRTDEEYFSLRREMDLKKAQINVQRSKIVKHKLYLAGLPRRQQFMDSRMSEYEMKLNQLQEE